MLHFDLQLFTQMSVQRGEGLVQHQQLWLADQDARQGRALLLAARKLAGQPTLQPCQSQQLHHLAQRLLTLRAAALFGAQAAEDVLPHRHVGKERIILEKIAHMPLLRGQVDPFFAVKQRYAVQLDMTAIGPLNACDALERHAFAAARSAQDAQHPVLAGKGNVQAEAPQALCNINRETHARALPSAGVPAY